MYARWPEVIGIPLVGRSCAINACSTKNTVDWNNLLGAGQAEGLCGMHSSKTTPSCTNLTAMDVAMTTLKPSKVRMIGYTTDLVGDKEYLKLNTLTTSALCAGTHLLNEAVKRIGAG